MIEAKKGIRRLRLLFILILFPFLSANLAFAEFGETEVGLPKVREGSKESFRFYKLKFLPDRYPGRRVKDKVIAHPIYGAYAITSYINQYEENGQKQYLEAAIEVARATINRMTYLPKYDAIVFYYTDDDGLTYYPGKFFSGLTQARYLETFYRLFQLSGDKRFERAAEQILNSLKIPQSEGGVLINTKYGPVVEEYPHEIPTFVLNGWTTVILELIEYYLRSGNKSARDFALENIKTVEKLLPLYDSEELFLSRYQLSGFVYLKIVFSELHACKVTSLESIAGGVQTKLTNGNNRWKSFLLDKRLRDDGFPKHRTIQANVIFSRLESTRDVDIEFHCEKPTKAKISIANAPYDPETSAMRTKTWATLHDTSLGSGVSKVSFPVTNQNFYLLGYPTNFAKKFNGIRYNVYHWLHILNFEGILNCFNSEILEKYTKKWEHYTHYWETQPYFKKGEYSNDLRALRYRPIPQSERQGNCRS